MYLAIKNLSPLLGAAWLCAQHPPAHALMLGRVRNTDTAVENVEKEEPTKKASEESAEPQQQTTDASTGFEDAGWIINYNVPSGAKEVDLRYDSSTPEKTQCSERSADGKTVKHWEQKHEYGVLSEEYLKNPSRSLPDFMPKDFFPYGQVWVNQLQFHFGKLGNVVLTNCYAYPASEMVSVNGQTIGDGDSVLLMTDDVVTFPGSLTLQQVRDFRIPEEVRMRIDLGSAQQPLQHGEWDAYWTKMRRDAEMGETEWHADYGSNHRRVDVSELERRLPREAFVKTKAKWRGSKIDEEKTRYCRVLIESVDTDADGEGTILRGRRYLPGSGSKTRAWSHRIPRVEAWERRDVLKKIFVSRTELPNDFDRSVRAFLRQRGGSEVIEGTTVEKSDATPLAEHGEAGDDSPSIEGDDESDLYQYDWNAQRAARRHRTLKRLYQQMDRGTNWFEGLRKLWNWRDWYGAWNWVFSHKVTDAMGTDDYEELDRWAAILEEMDPSALEHAVQDYAASLGWEAGVSEDSTADNDHSRDASPEDAYVDHEQGALRQEVLSLLVRHATAKLVPDCL